MSAPIFETVKDDPDVQSNLGVDPVRLWEFGRAPQTPTKPYAVWQTVTGRPENYLNQVPDADTLSLQVDVYATKASAARNARDALRNAIEPHAHITAWRDEDRDPVTNDYRVSFDVDFLVSRETVS